MIDFAVIVSSPKSVTAHLLATAIGTEINRTSNLCPVSSLDGFIDYDLVWRKAARVLRIKFVASCLQVVTRMACSQAADFSVRRMERCIG
jgi:hypothetical protein